MRVPFVNELATDHIERLREEASPRAPRTARLRSRGPVSPFRRAIGRRLVTAGLRVQGSPAGVVVHLVR